MRTGKSSVGRFVAEALHFTYLDTYQVIGWRAHETCSDIVRDDGEPAFRELDRRVVEELTHRNETVISAGGGLATNEEELDSLKTLSLVRCLWASPDGVYDRVR